MSPEQSEGIQFQFMTNPSILKIRVLSRFPFQAHFPVTVRILKYLVIEQKMNHPEFIRLKQNPI